jgi:putative endonuclease
MGATSGEVWFVYILECAEGSLYTGITKDLRRRCRQHNAGIASRYTRGRRPTKLVYHEAQPQPGAGERPRRWMASRCSFVG